MGLAIAPAGAAEDVPSLKKVSVVKDEAKETITYDNGSTFTSVPAAEVGVYGALAGSFDWTADFQIGFESRTYTAVNSGTHKVKINAIQNTSGRSPANCTSSQAVQVTLYREDFPTDTSLGMKTLPCSGGTASWSGAPADTYYFYVRVTGNYDSADLTSRRATGTTTYP
ncbi:hypothetical protein AB0942_12550 [Streptomyces nodosus]|uniref:hypothetical protein n=1 Tax=Streptomyces nodosus TaxID=40318 RepID=UPI003454B244